MHNLVVGSITTNYSGHLHNQIDLSELLKWLLGYQYVSKGKS